MQKRAVGIATGGSLIVGWRRNAILPIGQYSQDLNECTIDGQIRLGITFTVFLLFKFLFLQSEPSTRFLEHL